MLGRKNMTNDVNILELISQVTEFNDISEYMNDEELDKTLATVVKLIMKPDVPPQHAVKLIVELQALSAKFAMLKIYYTTIAKDKAGSINSNKKNVYRTAQEMLDRLVDVIKYSARYGA